ncbi:hypothetical protein BWI93_01860 [Siphonobacter sp. BAB-5385]|uniref:hypothetical protein n=1 Tax=Siphonobacter sp. BAB-5385 TaxID=1864822 RepID=UPI000B9DD0F7|nr:hypothetical protein [Siphonobacter sp. BAB-5385]OZI09807.1 hypothetical protein BWI93_01860 [Siphonobacter sp. BAB-5385]
MKGIYFWYSLFVLWIGLVSCRLELDPALDVTTIQIKIELEPTLKNAGLSPLGTEVILEDRSGKGPWRLSPMPKESSVLRRWWEAPTR